MLLLLSRHDSHINKKPQIIIALLSLLTESVVEISEEELKHGSNQAPHSLRPCAGDAYLLFQVMLWSQIIYGHRTASISPKIV